MFVGRPAPPDKKKEKKRSLEQGRQFLTWPTKRPEPNLVIQRSGSGWLFSVGLDWIEVDISDQFQFVSNSFFISTCQPNLKSIQPDYRYHDLPTELQ